MNFIPRRVCFVSLYYCFQKIGESKQFCESLLEKFIPWIPNWKGQEKKKKDEKGKEEKGKEEKKRKKRERRIRERKKRRKRQKRSKYKWW